MTRTPIVDGYYSWHLEGPERFQDWLARWPGPVRRAASRSGPVRGLLLCAASVRRPTVAMVRADPGWRTLLLARALLGRRRKLVAFQFILHPLPAGGMPRARERMWRIVDRWAVPRALRSGLVLTDWEAGLYARHYGMGTARFPHVPWAWRGERRAEPPPYAPDGPIVSGGRAFCDWPTLLAATAGIDRDLTVVCSREDQMRLGAAVRPGVEVMCEVPRDRFRTILERAALVVIVMHEANVSQGHVRLMEANEAGVPVVISGARAVSGYVVAGETAVVVAPGDTDGLRRAIEALLSSPGRRLALRDAAWRRSQRWSGPDFMRAVRDVLYGRVPTLPEEADRRENGREPGRADAPIDQTAG